MEQLGSVDIDIKSSPKIQLKPSDETSAHCVTAMKTALQTAKVPLAALNHLKEISSAAAFTVCTVQITLNPNKGPSKTIKGGCSLHSGRRLEPSPFLAIQT